MNKVLTAILIIAFVVLVAGCTDQASTAGMARSCGCCTLKGNARIE